MVAGDREQAATLADEVATEHLEVQTADDDWYFAAPAQLRVDLPRRPRDRRVLRQGDRHQPHAADRRAARYTGGLSVAKFLKTLTYQRIDTDEGVRARSRRTSPRSRART